MTNRCPVCSRPVPEPVVCDECKHADAMRRKREREAQNSKKQDKRKEAQV